jgi:hypothetical protein
MADRTRLVMSLAGIAAAAVALVLLQRCGAHDAHEPARAGSATASVGAPPTAGSALARNVIPLPSTSAAPSGAFATFGWGSDPNQLGRHRPDEANPEGPMSLARDGHGGALLLDQVNARVLHLDGAGKPLGAWKLGARGAQDLVTADDGTVAVLDRLDAKDVKLYDAAGNPRGVLPLEGKGIPESGAVTGVFTDGDKVYAETEHGALTLLGTTDGRTGDRSQLPGRPSRDGTSYLSAGITNANDGRVWVSAITRATNEHRFTRELKMGTPIPALLLLDSDKRGTIYLAMLAMAQENDPLVLLSCLSGKDGAPLSTLQIPANTMPEETFRELVVLDEGGVLHAEMTDSGVTYRKYDCK